MLSAGAWYENGNFWQFAITTIVAVAIGALGAWATMRASSPKLTLNWWVESNTPLMNLSGSNSSATSDLTVQWASVPISSPRIVELKIANTGRRDITAAMFHNGESVRFDFGVGLCTILDVTSQPAGVDRLSFAHGAWTVVGNQSNQDTWVDLRPALLTRGQVVSVMVLLDGGQEPVKCLRAPLVDVKVDSQAPYSWQLTAAEANALPSWAAVFARAALARRP
ncbi:hypothetical protein [Streptomyces phage phiScoe1]|nr:hypothetical protein [Streptomyces phage phiScoe1]